MVFTGQVAVLHAAADLDLPTIAGRPLTLETTTFTMMTATMIGSAISSGAW